MIFHHNNISKYNVIDLERFIIKRLIYIDVIRVIAMLLVVLAHACAYQLAVNDGSISWGISNALVSITEIAVPLFFMISGATILNSKKTTDLKYLFRYRLVRVIVPFLLWSVISAFFFLKVNNVFTFDEFFKKILLMYHLPVLTAYWFIYPLVGLYLLSPMLKVMVDHMSANMLNYVLVLWFAFDIFLASIPNATPKGIGMYFSLYSLGQIIASSSLGYFILGYKLTQIKHWKIDKLKTFLMMLSLIVINIIIRFITPANPLFILNIVAAINRPIIVSTVFLFLRSFEGNYRPWIAKVTEYLAPLTYGIYLIHGVVIEAVSKNVGMGNYPVIFVASVVISALIIFGLSKLPVIRKLLT